MGSKKINSYLNRRIWREDGTYYFCRLCGDYKHENEFYNSKHTPFGKTYKCRIHYSKTGDAVDDESEHLKMNPITDSDFEGAETVLKNLGFTFGPGELPVWKQFEIKHKLNKN
jgi:hypothetical protein